MNDNQLHADATFELTDEILEQSQSDAELAYDCLLEVANDLAAENGSEVGTTNYFVCMKLLGDLMECGWTVEQLKADVDDMAFYVKAECFKSRIN